MVSGNSRYNHLVFVNKKTHFFLPILLALNLSSCTLVREDSSVFTLGQIENITLYSGDVVFRRGSGLVSDLVMILNSQSEYSHVGVLVSREALVGSAVFKGDTIHGEWWVVHTVPYEGESVADDHIVLENLESFFGEDKAQGGAIYRVEMDSVSVSKIERYLMRELEICRPFDHDYSLESDSAHYCSELVYRAFMSVGMDLSSTRRTNPYVPSMPDEIITPHDLRVDKRLKLLYKF